MPASYALNLTFSRTPNPFAAGLPKTPNPLHLRLDPTILQGLQEARDARRARLVVQLLVAKAEALLGHWAAAPGRLLLLGFL